MPTGQATFRHACMSHVACHRHVACRMSRVACRVSSACRVSHVLKTLLREPTLIGNRAFFVKKQGWDDGEISHMGRISMIRANRHDGTKALTLMQIASSQYGRKWQNQRLYRDWPITMGAPTEQTGQTNVIPCRLMGWGNIRNHLRPGFPSTHNEVSRIHANVRAYVD